MVLEFEASYPVLQEYEAVEPYVVDDTDVAALAILLGVPQSKITSNTLLNKYFGKQNRESKKGYSGWKVE